jgi:hypothetical protein
MSRIAICKACKAQEHGMKTPRALEHTCGKEQRGMSSETQKWSSPIPFSSTDFGHHPPQMDEWCL